MIAIRSHIAFGDFQRVGAHQHRAAPLHELAEQVLEQAGALGIEAHHRLVHHDDLGLVHQRAGDDQLLPHPVAVRFGELVLPAAQLEQLEQLVDPALDDRSFLSIQRRREAEELRTGQLVVDEGPVGNVPQPSLGHQRMALNVFARDVHGAGASAQDSRDHPHRGGLAGAIGAQEAEQGSRRNVERQAVHGGERSVPLDETGDSDHWIESVVALSEPIRGTRMSGRSDPPMMMRSSETDAGAWP